MPGKKIANDHPVGVAGRSRASLIAPPARDGIADANELMVMDFGLSEEVGLTMFFQLQSPER